MVFNSDDEMNECGAAPEGGERMTAVHEILFDYRRYNQINLYREQQSDADAKPRHSREPFEASIEILEIFY